MKAFYVILCVCFTTFITIESQDVLSEWTEKMGNMSNYISACNNEAEIKFNKEDFQKYNSDEIRESPEMEHVRKMVGCLVSCVMQKLEIMNGTELHIAQMKDIIQLAAESEKETNMADIKMVIDVITDCGKQVEKITDVCLIGWNFGKCIENVVSI